jgi:nucleotide-binding universal stress UspA family protein
LTAAAAAAECGLPLQLVSVVHSDGERPRAESFVAEMLAQVAQRGVAAKGEVRVGIAFKEILAAREASSADLIVMASRTDRGIGRARVGGVAQNVMGVYAHPVLVLNLQTPRDRNP